MKPGYTTTEFATTITWIIVGGVALILPFFLDGDHTAVQITGALVGLFKGMGYDLGRTREKIQESKSEAVKELAKAPLEK